MHYEALNEETKKIWDKCGFLRDDFYLAGGTALALQIGHRVSVDLDFFSPIDIASMKAYTIGRRRSFKDYVDIYFILFRGHVTLDIIISDAKAKYGHAFNDRLFCEQLTSPEDLDDENIIWLEKEESKADMQTFAQKKVKEFLQSSCYT